MKLPNIFKHRNLIVVIVLVLFVGSLHSQPQRNSQNPELSEQQRQQLQNQKLYNTARALIRANRFPEAENILLTLRKNSPSNLSYYHGLFEIYLKTAAYDKAEQLVSEQKSLTANDQRYDIDLANIWYSMDRKNDAMALWNKLLKNNPKDLNYYNLVANAMLQNRLYDEAIEIYKQGIQNIPRAHFLYQNIANLYQARLMYSQAAYYYLKYLEQDPNQQNYVFARILSFPIEQDDQKAFLEKLNSFRGEFRLEEPLGLLIAQLNQRYGNYAAAFSEYRQLDQNLNNERYLKEFGKAAQRDSSFNYALQAYQLLLQNYPKSREHDYFQYEQVRTLFSLAKNNNKTDYADKANAIISEIEQDNQPNALLDRMKFQQGVFYLDFYFDLDKSIQIFQTLLNTKNVDRKLIPQIQLKLAETQSIRGDLEAAENTYQLVTQNPYQIDAFLGLANIYYYQKNWQKCEEQINKVLQSGGIASEAANDALEIQMQLSLQQTAPEILNQLAEADFLLLQHKKNEAVKQLNGLLEEKLTPDIKSQVLQKITQLDIDLGKYPEALESCNQAITDSSMAEYNDLHLFMMGNILEKYLQRPQDAFDAYQELLKSYPASILTENARRRMQALRDQKTPELP